MAGRGAGATAATDALVLPAFHRALNAQGFVEGQNVSVEYRYYDSQFDRLPDLVADLVGRRAAVIVAVGDGPPTIGAIQAASATMPIVGFTTDPIKEGFARSLNRPYQGCPRFDANEPTGTCGQKKMMQRRKA